MLPVYVLSYSHKVIVQNESLQVYQWTRVGSDQVLSGMDFLYTLPKLKAGSTLSFKVSNNREQILKVLGNGNLRQMTTEERKQLNSDNSPIIRIG